MSIVLQLKEPNDLETESNGDAQIAVVERKVAEFGYEPVADCETLVFPNMNITSVAFESGVGMKLRRLTLNFNCLSSLDFLLANDKTVTPVLEHLNVQHNHLTSLKGIPSSVRVLKCSYNRLTSLRELIVCTELRELWVTDNEFHHPGLCLVPCCEGNCCFLRLCDMGAVVADVVLELKSQRNLHRLVFSPNTW